MFRSVEMRAMNIGQVLLDAADRSPDRVAIVIHRERRMEFTFAEIARSALRRAAVLESRGLHRGDRIALVAGNDEHFVATWFAITLLGAIVVPIPVVSPAPEIRVRLDRACAKAVVADAPRADVARRAAGERSVLAIESLDDVDATPIDPRDPGDPSCAMILFTSGTTGGPRGAAIAHHALVDHTRSLVTNVLRLGANDVTLGVLPLTHSYGCRMVMLASVIAGARFVLVPRFDAQRSFDLLRDERITFLPGVPTMFAAWGDLADAPTPSSLRWCLSAGAPIADETVRRAEARLGAEVRQGYGLTEATFSTVNAPPDARVVGSVGRAVPGVEIRIVDPSGAVCESDRDGEIHVRGSNVMSRYLDDEVATRDAFHEGWLRTGDVGRLDGDGRLRVVDRIKDLVIRGGNNVYPSEVEDVLASHPSVAAVAVVGRHDAHYGEEVVAVIVPRVGHIIDPAELDAYARERLASTKVPREIVVVDELPLGPSGKVLKRVIRERVQSGEWKPTRVALYTAGSFTRRD